jgi:hypothetical protein
MYCFTRSAVCASFSFSRFAAAFAAFVSCSTLPNAEVDHPFVLERR